jgi:hypothetical protein
MEFGFNCDFSYNKYTSVCIIFRALMSFSNQFCILNFLGQFQPEAQRKIIDWISYYKKIMKLFWWASGIFHQKNLELTISQTVSLPWYLRMIFKRKAIPFSQEQKKRPQCPRPQSKLAFWSDMRNITASILIGHDFSDSEP